MKHPNFNVKLDRLRYTKNSLSALFAYVAILFNVFYFVSIYGTDVGEYYYTIEIGISVICNLLFLLFSFLCSEGVKNYKYSYSIAFIPLGVFQLIRILGFPIKGHSTVITYTGKEILVMQDDQFFWTCACLIISAVACFIASAVGIYKTKSLKDYEKKISE